MASVHDVMAYIKSVYPEAGPMQHHKLAYYTQAWHTAWEGRPLFPEPIEAWKHGPVCKEAWVAETYGPPTTARPLDDSARQVVDAVLTFYGRFTAAQLRGMTHNEGPWLQARGHLPESEPSSEEIKVSEMRRYYSRKSVLGEPTPQRPALPTQSPPTHDAVRVAERVANRWRKALDELAAR